MWLLPNAVLPGHSLFSHEGALSRIADQQSDVVETSVKVVMQRASNDRELGALGNVASSRAERHAQCAENRVRFFLDKVEPPLLHQLHLDRES
jgi:hypothetical protein